MTDKTQALIQAHLKHILSTLESMDVLIPEIDALMAWLATQPIGELVPLARIQLLARQRALDVPLTENLRQEIVNIIQTALDHPDNPTTKIGDLIPNATVETVANYLSSQKDHREALIHEVFSNPAYAQMLSQTISHAITDYMENNVFSKKMPAVGGLMKLGKNMLERATDSNLDEALQQYLNKNIKNLIGVSERMANKHLNDQQVHMIITQAWEKIKAKPVSEARRFAPAQTIDDTAHMIHDTWNHLRQTGFIQKQVDAGVAAWYARHASRTVMDILADVNVTPEIIREELQNGLLPIIKRAMDSGYPATRIEGLLRAFYESADAQAILNA